MNKPLFVSTTDGTFTPALDSEEAVFPDRPNFVIMSHFGRHDWSGFRTLKECLDQKMSPRESGFYQIVER